MKVHALRAQAEQVQIAAHLPPVWVTLGESPFFSYPVSSCIMGDVCVCQRAGAIRACHGDLCLVSSHFFLAFFSCLDSWASEHQSHLSSCPQFFQRFPWGLRYQVPGAILDWGVEGGGRKHLLHELPVWWNGKFQTERTNFVLVFS